uniref:AP-3 complex subunit delta-1 n=1 Tax=Apis cerana TaxID=7461 RepID=V9II65_APICE
MWLENNTSSENIQPPVTNEYSEVFSEKESEWKDIKRKKSKSQEKYKKTDENSKHRKSKKSKIKKESSKKSSDYEETAGISTPSKEILPDLRYNFTNSEDNTILEPLTSYEELANNKILSIMYKLKQIPHESNKLIASILITNNCQKPVKELVFDIPDTSSLRLMRNTGDEFGIKLPFQLPPQITKETQFTILISDVTFAQRLRGTLTYMLESKESTLQEKT